MRHTSTSRAPMSTGFTVVTQDHRVGTEPAIWALRGVRAVDIDRSRGQPVDTFMVQTTELRLKGGGGFHRSAQVPQRPHPRGEGRSLPTRQRGLPSDVQPQQLPEPKYVAAPEPVVPLHEGCDADPKDNSSRGQNAELLQYNHPHDPLQRLHPCRQLFLLEVPAETLRQGPLRG